MANVAKRQLLILITAVAAIPALPCVAAATGRSFVEDFSTFSRQRWNISNGWSNGEHQGCTWAARNVTRKESRLRLALNDTASKERPFSCAEIQTTELYGYGTYEVRMRSAAAPGTVSAFFTYTGPGFSPDLPHDEIDFEFLGKNPGGVQVNYFTNGDGNHGHDVELSYDSSKSFADYAFEWLPNRIRWFVNGKLVHEVEGGADTPLPASPGRIILSIWNGKGPDVEGWLGPFAYLGNPLVAVYERVSFTAAGEPCQYPESVVCQEHPAPPAAR